MKGDHSIFGCLSNLFAVGVAEKGLHKRIRATPRVFFFFSHRFLGFLMSRGLHAPVVKVDAGIRMRALAPIIQSGRTFGVEREANVQIVLLAADRRVQFFESVLKKKQKKQTNKQTNKSLVVVTRFLLGFSFQGGWSFETPTRFYWFFFTEFWVRAIHAPVGFSTSFTEFYRVLPSCTEFYRYRILSRLILLGFTEFFRYRISLPRCLGCSLILPSFTEFYRVLPSFGGIVFSLGRYYWVLPSLVDAVYAPVICFTGFYRVFFGIAFSFFG